MNHATLRAAAQALFALALVYGAYLLFRPFVVPVLTAGVIALVVRPFYLWLRQKCSPTVGAALTVLAVILGILVPTSLFSFFLVREVGVVAVAIEHSHINFDSLNTLIANGAREIGFSSAPTVDLRAAALSGLSYIGSHSTDFLGGVVGVLGHTALVLFGLFYLLQGLPHSRRYLSTVSPLNPEDTERIIKRVEEVVQATVRGNSIIVILQGILFMIACLIFGVQAPVLLGLLYGLTSLIPVVGSSTVWVPLALYYAVNGQLGLAIGLTTWTFIQIAVMDNFVGPRLIGNRSRLNPFIALIGLLGGVEHFGLLGFIVGPTIMALGLLGLEMLGKAWKQEPTA